MYWAHVILLRKHETSLDQAQNNNNHAYMNISLLARFCFSLKCCENLCEMKLQYACFRYELKRTKKMPLETETHETTTYLC